MSQLLKTGIMSSGALLLGDNAWKGVFCKLASLTLHSLILSILLLAVPGRSSAVLQETGVQLLTHLYIPSNGSVTEKVTDAHDSLTPPQSQEDDPSQKLDLDGMRLVLKADPGYRGLESALKHFGGLLAFASPGQPRFTGWAFAAPGWQRLETAAMLSIDDFLAIAVEEPDRWMVAVRLRRQFSIPNNDLVYALFPATFLSQLDRAVRQAALQQASRGRVAEAIIGFSSDTARGFLVERVAVVQ